MNYTTTITEEDLQEFIDSDVTDGNVWVEITDIEFDSKSKSLKVEFWIHR